MTLLLLGLVLFLGTHSVRIFAEDWRGRRIAAMGPMAWKGVYSLLAIAGFVLIVYGYAAARQAPVVLYIAARRRDRAAGTVYVVGPVTRDIIAVVAGLVAWAVFAMWLHRPLIGVGPFG